MWKSIHIFINQWDPVQIAYLCWSSQHDKVQEWLFYRKSAGCAASRLSLQSAVMEWWMLWRADRLFFSPPLLPVDMPHSLCLDFVIPHEQKGLLIDAKTDSYCMSVPRKSARDDVAESLRLTPQKLCIFREILTYQCNMFRLNYRKQDWFRNQRHAELQQKREVFHHNRLDNIGKCTSYRKVGYSLWLNGMLAKPFCLVFSFFLFRRELFLKAKVNAVMERTLIHSHVKWPCEESPGGEKGLEWIWERQRVGERQM